MQNKLLIKKDVSKLYRIFNSSDYLFSQYFEDLNLKYMKQYFREVYLFLMFVAGQYNIKDIP